MDVVDDNIFDLNGILREAEVLADELRGRYKYSSEEFMWYRFNGTHYEPSFKDEVLNVVEQVVADTLRQISSKITRKERQKSPTAFGEGGVWAAVSQWVPLQEADGLGKTHGLEAPATGPPEATAKEPAPPSSGRGQPLC